MNVTIPVLNETFKRKSEYSPIFRCRVLFIPVLQTEDFSLRRATNRLLELIRNHLNPMGRTWDHRELAWQIFNPPLKGTRLKLEVELKSRRAKVTYFVVSFPRFGRRLGFIPGLPDSWFEFPREHELENYARDFVNRYFRKLEKDADRYHEPEFYSINGETWISLADVDIRTDPITEDELKQQMLALFSNEQMDGASELHKVGRCLDQLYPDDLQRASRRERLVD